MIKFTYKIKRTYNDYDVSYKTLNKDFTFTIETDGKTLRKDDLSGS